MARLTPKLIAAIQKKGIAAMIEGKPQSKEDCDICSMYAITNTDIYEYIEDGEAYFCEDCASKLGLVW